MLALVSRLCTSQNFVQLEAAKSQVNTHALPRLYKAFTGSGNSDLAAKGFTFQTICLLTFLVLFKNKITGWVYLVFL